MSQQNIKTQGNNSPVNASTGDNSPITNAALAQKEKSNFFVELVKNKWVWIVIALLIALYLFVAHQINIFPFFIK